MLLNPVNGSAYPGRHSGELLPSSSVFLCGFLIGFLSFSDCSHFLSSQRSGARPGKGPVGAECPKGSRRAASSRAERFTAMVLPGKWNAFTHWNQLSRNVGAVWGNNFNDLIMTSTHCGYNHHCCCPLSSTHPEEKREEGWGGSGLMLHAWQ